MLFADTLDSASLHKAAEELNRIPRAEVTTGIEGPVFAARPQTRFCAALGYCTIILFFGCPGGAGPHFFKVKKFLAWKDWGPRTSPPGNISCLSDVDQCASVRGYEEKHSLTSRTSRGRRTAVGVGFTSTKE